MTKAEHDLSCAWMHTEDENLVLDLDALADERDESAMSDAEFAALMAD